jgi:hypothetical protein
MERTKRAGQFPKESWRALDEVIGAASPITDNQRETLISRLGELDFLSQLHRIALADHAPSTLLLTFHAIRAAADRLLEALEVSEKAAARGGTPEQVREGLKYFCPKGDGDDFDEDLWLDGTIERVRYLRGCARQAVDRERLTIEYGKGKSSISKSLARKRNNSIINYIVLDLWKETLGRTLSVSYSKKASASGPLIRFIVACYKLVGLEPPTPDAASAKVRNIRQIW